MRLILALWLGTSVAPAQPVPFGKDLPNRALVLLGSDAVSDRAWGAYLCGSLLIADCRAPLMLALDRAAPLAAAPDESEEFWYVQALLDGLIRSGAVASPGLLLRFDPRWRDEILVLLAGGPDAAEPLLRISGGPLTSAEWLAVNNLLLRMKSGSFFVRMLEQATIEHFFVVYDVERRAGYPGALVNGGFRQDFPLRKVPTGFPPVGVYELESHARPGATVLAWGPCYGTGTVNYTRLEIRPEGTPFRPRRRTRSASAGSIECRNAYLAAFREMPLEAANEVLRPTTRIRWAGAADFQRRANQAMDENAQGLRTFIAGARVDSLAAAADLRVTIHPRVFDNRAVKIPLPMISPRVVKADGTQ